MGTPHKHRDVIIAWANGEEIEHLDEQGWFVWDSSVGFTPDFNCGNWRIKPKIVKKQANVAVYKLKDGSYKVQLLFFGDMHFTIEGSTMVTRQPIEWEEEV